MGQLIKQIFQKSNFGCLIRIEYYLLRFEKNVAPCQKNQYENRDAFVSIPKELTKKIDVDDDGVRKLD